MSVPNFVVEVTKQAAKHSLVFDCHFPEDEVKKEKVKRIMARAACLSLSSDIEMFVLI